MQTHFNLKSFCSLIFLCFSILLSAADNELVFCVTGDSRGGDHGINKKILTELVNALKAENPAFVAVNGDLVSGYSSKLQKQLEVWRDTFMAPLLDAGINVYACRGNHDANSGHFRKKGKSKLFWDKVFSGRFVFPDNGPEKEKNTTYYVKDKNVLLFILDSYKRKPTHKVDVDWMKKVFKKEKGKTPLHVFVVTHEPAYAVHHKDCLASEPKARDEFVNIFLKNKGVCFFCGHDHLYDHSKINLPAGEFHQFVCGTAGAPLYKWDGKYQDKRVQNVKSDVAFGYMVVKIKGNKAELTMKAWDKHGKLKVIDTFTYTLK